MNNNILIAELIKDKNVGAIASTSNHIITKMLNKIKFKNAKVIVEYGSGRGIITKQLLNKMDNETILYAFETNIEFINSLKKINDRRLIIINSDAKNAIRILKDKYDIEKVDYVVSTIPFTFIERRKRKRIIYKTYTLLKDGGKFITYQYSWLIYSLIKERFSTSNISVSLQNIPPVFIIDGTKLKK